MITLASIHRYPIKSLGGHALTEARLTPIGLEHDRRWMLVDAKGCFISQREVPLMALLHTAPSANGFTVTDIRTGEAIELPWTITGPTEKARVWDDVVEVVHAPHPFTHWFMQRLPRVAALVYQPDSTHRPVDPHYAQGQTSLSDGFPYLIASQRSLDDLNARLPSPIPMDRFRPNLVVSGGQAFQEDGWRDIAIGTARFALVKPCARCVITTTDQRTAERGKEPLRTLATFRRRAGAPEKVDFGMNAMQVDGDVVRVRDLVSLLP
ncbi:MAG TPA: MOSC N-terminal beta barrel domain-containing protein [Flavobacteriales bacterium]|jgi:hypothetical protein|nr:MOSC N-terminal beta barrel domain-containing protein [Flavobacteriales bacterium]